TFTTDSGTELDLVRKDWGYYATSSNRRLRDHGLRLVLCAHDDGRVTPLVVEAGREEAFEAYLAAQPMRVVAWLDTDEAAAEAVRRREGPRGWGPSSTPGWARSGCRARRWATWRAGPRWRGCSSAWSAPGSSTRSSSPPRPRRTTTRWRRGARSTGSACTAGR